MNARLQFQVRNAKRMAAEHACDLIETQHQDRCDAIAEACKLFDVSWASVERYLRAWNV